MKAKAWAPGHATLFFSVPESPDNPKEKGSLGGGLNFKSGVITVIQKHNSDEITWNQDIIEGEVTLTALELFRNEVSIDHPVKIDHYSKLRIGHGLSTSGAGTLGTALALNELFGTKLTTEKLFEIAHLADIVNHTGLGSVMGQITGSIELRTRIGGPGIGVTQSFPSDNEVLILMGGKLKTSDVLQSSTQMEKITHAGEVAVMNAMSLTDNFLQGFIKIGRKFTMDCGLLTNRIEEILDELERIGEPLATMAMIGETIIVKPGNKSKILQLSNQFDLTPVVTSIDSRKPHLRFTDTSYY